MPNSSATPWTITCQALLSMGFSRQEYWSGLPFPSPGDFADPGIEPVSLSFPALAGGFFITEPSGRSPTVPGAGDNSEAGSAQLNAALPFGMLQ